MCINKLIEVCIQNNSIFFENIDKFVWVVNVFWVKKNYSNGYCFEYNKVAQLIRLIDFTSKIAWENYLHSLTFYVKNMIYVGNRNFKYEIVINTLL